MRVQPMLSREGRTRFRHMLAWLVLAVFVLGCSDSAAPTSTDNPTPTTPPTFTAALASIDAGSAPIVFVGFHFRHAARVGLEQGVEVGNYVVGNALRPIRSER